MLGQFLPPKLILRKLLRVDGEGSGLDCDKWDGYERNVKPARIFIPITNGVVPHKINASDPPTRVVLGEGDLPDDFFILTDIVLFGSHEPRDTGEPEPWYDADVDFETGKIHVYGYNNSTSVDYTFSGTFVLNYLAGEHVAESGITPEGFEVKEILWPETTLSPQQEITRITSVVYPPGHVYGVENVSVEFEQVNPAEARDYIELSAQYDEDTALLSVTMKNNYPDFVYISGAIITVSLGYFEAPAPYKDVYMSPVLQESYEIQAGGTLTLRKHVEQLDVEEGEILKSYVSYAGLSASDYADQLDVSITFDNNSRELVAQITNNAPVPQTIYFPVILSRVRLKLLQPPGGSEVFEGGSSRCYCDAHGGDYIWSYTASNFGHIDYLYVNLEEYHTGLHVGVWHPTPSNELYVVFSNSSDEAVWVNVPYLEYRTLHA